jgi:ABC-type glycerol-3-phosphate transport system substrate-binding protein
MKKIIFALLALAVLFAAAACTSVITAPVDATNNPIGSKVGEQSETVHFVWILPFSYSIDASAYKAAQNGGITKIATVDVQRKDEWRLSRYFPLFHDVTITTIVTGE